MTDSVQIIDEQIYSLEIVDSENYLIEINDQTPTSVDIGFAVIGQTGPAGPQGPKGDAGNSTIGGYEITLSNITSGDVLKFGTGAWINSPEQDLTDGGNF